jgi:riboflavin kinase
LEPHLQETLTSVVFQKEAMQQQFRSSGVLAIFLLNLVLLARLSRSFVVQAPRLARWHQNKITSASFRTCPLLQSKTSEEDQEKLLQIHKTASDDSLKTSSSPHESEKEHLLHQQQVFDKMSHWFADSEKEVPPELVPVYQHLAHQIVTQLQESFQTGVDQRNARGLNGLPEKAPNAYRILDVACGTGVLWNFLLEAADQRGVKLFITGVDLSEKMVETGTERAKQVLAKSSQSHTIDVIQSEILEYCASPNNANDYHGVIANGCFGNFWDQRQVVDSLSNALLLDGVLTISHPLGAEFVAKLHKKDASTVPHLLPSTQMEVLELIHGLNLSLEDFCTQLELKMGESTEYYLASASKCRHNSLEKILRFRGAVDKGYGRGGKKLGVPTANLPASLFETALGDVPTGVYFGWAVLEDASGDKPGRNIPQKAVVNVGYTPTFIEAHLILEEDDDITDFSGETMRLQLNGFLREPIFPELITQIKTDVQDAKDALDLEPYASFQNDPFVKEACQTDAASWVGKSGGDDKASWEHQSMLDTLRVMIEVPKN